MAKHAEKAQKASSTHQQDGLIIKAPRGARPGTTGVLAPLDAKPNITGVLAPLEETDEEAATPVTTRLSPVKTDIRRRQFLISGLGAAVTLAGLGTWIWAETPRTRTSQNQTKKAKPEGDKVVLQWNNAAVKALSTAQFSAPLAARALAIVHTCIFDAWAAYDTTASGTQLEARLRRPDNERTLANKTQAISFAAYRALVDLFPAQQADFQQIMKQLGYNAANTAIDPETPEGIGNMAAQAVLTFRHQDGANQLGNLHPGAYSDYTKYAPVITTAATGDPNHWQPMEVATSRVGFGTQSFVCAQWSNVAPFSLARGAQFLPKPGPAHYPSSLYTQQAQEILQYSADLTDEHKVIAEYWTYNPSLQQPVGHWSLLAQLVSQRDRRSLDDNVKMFFAVTNALLDASIAVWSAKRTYDSAYPITAIHNLFHDKEVQAWAGPGKGIQHINGTYWQPYQPESQAQPAYPEYCSEHSAFSAAVAAALRNFTGSDRFGLSFTWPAHSSLIEPGVPANDLTLAWKTFTQAANQAGLSQRYSGTHFAQSDLDGRKLGSQVGEQVWKKVLSHIQGK